MAGRLLFVLVHPDGAPASEAEATEAERAFAPPQPSGSSETEEAALATSLVASLQVRD
jgi:hypothetical protein